MRRGARSRDAWAGIGIEAAAAAFANHFVRSVPQLLCTYRSSICAEDARPVHKRVTGECKPFLKLGRVATRDGGNRRSLD
jgi:hypothetical protein